MPLPKGKGKEMAFYHFWVWYAGLLGMIGLAGLMTWRQRARRWSATVDPAGT